MKPRVITSSWLTAAALLAGVALSPVAQANDWVGTVGDWSDPLNWNGGVPNNAGGWAIGNVQNGGTAIVSTTVPNVSEAWAGNLGGAGIIIVTNGGVLNVDNWLVVARMCCPSPTVTPWSDLIVNGGTVNKRGDGFIIGDAGGGQGGQGRITVAGNSQVNVTGGWFSLGVGEATAIGYFQDNSVYTSPGYDFNVADTGIAKATCYLKDNATIRISRFFLGKGFDNVGALWQSGGSMIGDGTAANEWTIGGDGNETDLRPNSFGFYGLSAGTLTCPYNFQVGRTGKGILYQSGGTNTQAGWCDTGRYVGSHGVAWITGGLFQHTGTSTHYIVAENGRGEVTLSGNAILDTTSALWLGNGASFVNLNGGTLQIPGIEEWSGSVQSTLNFNGTTIKAKAHNPNFIPSGLSEARILAGNAIFDTAGYDITIGQALVDGSGQGVLSIPITEAGAGYIAPPIVQITADGNGAQAVAQIDPVAGTLTNIVVVCPGYGYGAPTVELIGGGATTPATLGTPVVGAVAGGGLIKNGAGTLTLSGANSYTGATVVNAGKLAVTTDPTGMGAYTVAAGAGLSVKLTAGGGQLTASSLTLGASTLDLDLGGSGNPAMATLRASGNLAVNGTITVNIADALPQIGQFPLIEYTTRSGSGTFVLGTLPTGVQATLVDNTLAKTVDLNITSVGLPRWDGQVSADWDIDTTTNWVELSTGLPTKFKNGAPALFNDSALGATSVNLLTTVLPAGVTVTNATLEYTFSGVGKISGSQGLLKQGTGNLTIANANDYTGPTVISGGKLIVTNLANGGQPSAIGAATSAATNLVLAGGTLSYAGPAKEVDRGYSVQGAGSTIETVSDLALSGPVTATVASSSRKTGAGRLTYKGAGTKELSGGANPGYNVFDGTLVFDGSGGGQINHIQNDLWVASTIDTPAYLILTNTVLNVDGWLALGRGNGASDYLSTATLYDSKLRTGNFSMGYDNNVAGNLTRQILTLNGTSSITNVSDMNLGESGGSTSTILLNDNSVLFSDSRIHLGWHAGGVGTMTLANSSIVNVDAWFCIGNEGGTGTLIVKDSSKLRVLDDMNVTDVNTGTGTMTVQDNAQVEWGSLYVGKGEGSVGVLNQTGGSMLGTRVREAHIGFRGQGTFNLSGGSVVAPSHWFVVGRHATGPGEFNITGGTFIHGTNDAGRLFRIGEDGTGILNISGTADVRTGGDALTLGNNAGGNGTVNLNGGSLQVRRIVGGPGAGTFNFNGGTLKAGPNANADFMTGLTAANLNANVTVIDTGANNIGITQPLLAGTGAGGLTKLGSGTLNLNGANTYTGTTTVSAGTLGGSGTIAGPVTVSATATFAPGTSVGTLTINNSLTLNGTTVMEVSRNGDVATSDLASVTGNLQFGGVLNIVVNSTNALAKDDTFNLFDWGTRSGSFTTINLPAGYTWDTSQLTVDGTIKVTAVLASPKINPPTVSSGNLILTGTGGTAGSGYTWLTSTNVAAPAIEWTPTVTGAFDTAGAFSNAIPVSAAEKARFFRMRVP